MYIFCRQHLAQKIGLRTQWNRYEESDFQMMGSNQLNGTTDSSVMKNTKNINTETNNSYGLLHIPSSKYPKIAKKSVRLLLPVKHTVPTLTDEY